jgi:hypothetical protein
VNRITVFRPKVSVEELLSHFTLNQPLVRKLLADPIKLRTRTALNNAPSLGPGFFTLVFSTFRK